MSTSIPSPTIPYTTEGTGTRTLETLEVAENYNRWILDRLRPGIGQRVLEVGCGMGTITRLLSDRELVVGVDVVEEFIDWLHSGVIDRPNTRYVRCDVSSDLRPLAGLTFDSAVSVNVFEHIERDEQAMAGVFRLLQPGGTFALLVPAHPALYGEFDRALGHHRRYTRGALTRKLRSAGFHIDRLYYSNPVGALGWLVSVRLMGRRQLGGVGLFDRLVPVLSVLDRVLPWPFGLQVIAIARKPA